MNSFTEALLGGIEKIAPGLSNYSGSSAYDRISQFGNDFLGTITSRGLSPLERSAQAEVDKNTTQSAPNFIPQASAMQMQRDSMAVDRNAEVKRLQSLPTQSAFSGPGTTVVKASGTGQMSVPIPSEIPQSPTAYDLAHTKSQGEVVQQLISMQQSGILKERTVAGGLAKAAARGLTLGISGREDPSNPVTEAENTVRPVGGMESIARAGVEMGTSFVPYHSIARAIGGSLMATNGIRNAALANPLLFRSVVENFGQAAADMAIRKGTGQEYHPSNFVMQVALGGLFEMGNYGLSKAAGRTYAPYTEMAIQKQLNDAVGQMKQSLGRMPTPGEIYDSVKDTPIQAMKIANKLDMTFGDLYKESRLAHFRTQSGVAGMDYSAPPGGERAIEARITAGEIPTPEELAPYPELFRKYSGVKQMSAAEVEAQLGDNAPLSGYDNVEAERVRLLNQARGITDQPSFERSMAGEQRMPGLKGDKNLNTDGQQVLGTTETAVSIAESVRKGDQYASEAVADMRAKAHAFGPTTSDADLEAKIFEPTTWSHFKDVAGKALNSRYLESFGKDGEEIARLIDQADQEGSIAIGVAMRNGTKLMQGLTKEESDNFVQAAQGLDQPMNQKVIDLVQWWDGVRKDIGTEAEKSGIQIRMPDGNTLPFKQRADYYPRAINKEKLQEYLATFNKEPTDFKRAFYQKIVDGSVDPETGIPAIGNITEAKRMWNDVISPNANVRYGHLESARSSDFIPQDILSQITDTDPRKVLSDYIVKGYRRIADAKYLGPDQELVNELVDSARAKGYDSETMLELVNRVTGREAATQKGAFSPGITAVSRAVRTYNTITKLSLSGISNLADTWKISARNGFIPALKGIVKSFTQEGIDQGMRSGVVDANLRSLAEEVGDTQLASQFMKYTGFQATEGWIRNANANAAISYADILLNGLKRDPENMFAYRRLAQFIENPDEAIARGMFTQAEKDIIGFTGIADTQPLRRLDLPHYWQSPTGRGITQFKSFAYKQMTFTKNFVVDEAAQGNVRPLLSLLILGQVVGEPISDIKAWVRGRTRDESVGRRIAENYMTVGGVGLLSDFLVNLQYGQMGGGFLRYVAGPSLTDIDDWLGRLTSPNRVKQVEKKVTSMVPVVGPALSNTIFPSNQPYRARTIPILEDILKLQDKANSAGEGSSGRVNPYSRTTRANPYKRVGR